RVAVLWNPSNQAKIGEWNDSQEPARIVGLTLRSFEARSQEELDGALAAIGQYLPDALIVFAESLTIAFRQRIGSFTLANRLPMVSELREFAEAGGGGSYGTSRAGLLRGAGLFFYKNLRRGKAGAPPLEQT